MLWDCCKWLYKQIKSICNRLSLRLPRSQYRVQAKRQQIFSLLRRKSNKKRKKRRHQLLYLCNKLSIQLQGLFNQGKRVVEDIKPAIFSRFKVVKTIYFQQNYMHQNKVKKIAHRVVSLYKPYLRPIIRGKANMAGGKRVEFGAKVHTLQVDGVSFIEHLSFEAYHEGIRMWNAIGRHKRYFGKICKQYGGDRIYATNKNRKKASKLGIMTSFRRKGRPAKNEKERQKMRGILSTARATILEGSYGNEKNHYLLKKVKARTQQTEIFWIFLSIHTANAVKIAKRRANKKEEELRKKAPS